MAQTPATPTNFYTQQGNGQIAVTWDITTGVTGYSVQRSTDGVTFTTVSSPTANQYVDTAVTLGTTYYYQVAAINSAALPTTSAYTTAQLIVPTPSGEMCLAEIRTRSQQRCDRLGSNFVTLPEWNSNINQSLFELYDLLTTVYEDYYSAPAAIFTCNGSDFLYTLPNGAQTFTSLTGSTFVAAPFYKLLGVDLGINTTQNGWANVNKFNFIDRNKFIYPNSNSTLYGVFNMQYRLLGSQIEFIPIPSSGQQIRLWYIPRMVQLLLDNDLTTQGISGWLEYVIVDCAIKALQKEEADVSVLMAQKMALKERIEGSSVNRDVGQPDTISDVRESRYGSSGRGWSGGTGGW